MEATPTLVTQETSQEARVQRVHDLAQSIMEHRRRYYQGNPTISDTAFDALEDELRTLDPDHPALKEVGSEIAPTRPSMEHAVPMLSLEKTYVLEDLLSWAGTQKVVGLTKIDGNSISLVYQAGSLRHAKTRGNGRMGEVVTDKARWVASIPHRIQRDELLSDTLEIRGELHCTASQFVRLASEMVALGLERPTSPRNIVAGLLGRREHYHLARFFTFTAFDLLASPWPSALRSEWEKLQFLKQLGFDLPRPSLLTSSAAIQEYLDQVRTWLDEDEIAIDGAVFTLNDLRRHEELGATSHHPRYKLSFKWQGSTAVTQIERIVWNTSRLGIVTPVAVVTPVALSSATIQNVTLHNAAHVAAYNLKPGDHIEIVRSGEVIPKFLVVTQSAPGQYAWPTVCPSCKTPLEFDDVRLRCPNREGCTAQRAASLLNWIRNVEIEDLSDKRLEALMVSGLVREIADLYKLRPDDLKQIPQVQDKMAHKLWGNIQQSKVLPLVSFLHGLGIAGAGRATWTRIVEVAPTLQAVRDLTLEDLSKIPGFAAKSSEQIVEGLRSAAPTLEALIAAGVTPTAAPTPSAIAQTHVTGKSIAITGTLSAPRAAVENRIRAAGGQPTSSVSRHTFALVCNDQSSGSSKLKKARELGVPLWTEADLYRYLEARNTTQDDGSPP